MSEKKSAWQEKLTFLDPKAEPHEVRGEILNFYPVSTALLFKLRNLAKPLAQALRTLFASQQNDTGQTYRRFEGSGQETIITPIAPDLARMRAEQMDNAIEGLIVALTDEKNAAPIGEMIVDSLREKFPRGSMKPEDCATLVKEIDVPTLKDMLVGVAKGNKKVLGPFGDLAMETLGRVTGRVASVAESLKAIPSESPKTTAS